MKIIIEEEFALVNKTGIGNYTLNVMKALDCLNINWECYDKKFFIKYMKHPYLKNILYMLWLNSVFLLKLIREKEAIILLSTNHFLPFIKLKKCKYYVVIHDIRLFKYPNEVSKIGGFLFRKRVLSAIRNADKIITVSETVKKEIIEYFNYPEDKIKVLYNTTSIKQQDNQNILERYNIKNKNYILSVSSLNKNKNICSLIEAFEKISKKNSNIKLVLVGNKGNAKNLITNNQNIVFTGFISDEELAALYSKALLYCSPSLSEGFGIPNIEAQMLGIPVLCSNIPVYKEICLNSAEFCETSSESIAQKLDFLINNKERLQELSEAGLINVKRFSSDKILNRLREIINE